jgi:hypothetical protein
MEKLRQCRTVASGSSGEVEAYTCTYCVHASQGRWLLHMYSRLSRRDQKLAVAFNAALSYSELYQVLSSNRAAFSSYNATDAGHI